MKQVCYFEDTLDATIYQFPNTKLQIELSKLKRQICTERIENHINYIKNNLLLSNKELEEIIFDVCAS